MKFRTVLFLSILSLVLAFSSLAQSGNAFAREPAPPRQSPVVFTAMLVDQGVRYNLSFVKPAALVLSNFSANVTLPGGAQVITVFGTANAPFAGATGDTLSWTSASTNPDEEVLNFIFVLNDPDLLGLPDTFTTPPLPSCTVTTTQNASAFEGPSGRFSAPETLAGGTSGTAIAQSLDTQDFIWWELENSLWLREDVVEEAGDCAALPVYDLRTKLTTSLMNASPVPPSTPLLTGDFTVSITWEGGSVNYTGNPGLTEARGAYGDIALNNAGTGVELLPVSNTGVQVGIERGEVPNSTVISIQELPTNENPPEKFGDFWWCSVLKVDNLPQGAQLTVLVPLRQPLPPGTPVSLFYRQDDGEWVTMSSIGVVSYDGHSVAYLHPGGVVATGVSRIVQPEPVVTETTTTTDTTTTDTTSSGDTAPPPDTTSQESTTAQRIPAGSETTVEQPPADNSGSGERSGGEEAPPADQQPVDQQPVSQPPADQSASGGQTGAPPPVVEEPQQPDTSCPPGAIEPVPALQQLAQYAVDRGLEPDPALTLVPEPLVSDRNLNVVKDSETTPLAIHQACGLLNGKQVCTLWVNVGDCVAGVMPLQTCVTKGSIVCSPN